MHVQDSGCTSKAAVALLDLIPASDSRVEAAAVQSAPVLVLSQTPLITEVSDCAFSSHEPDIVECTGLPFCGPGYEETGAKDCSVINHDFIDIHAVADLTLVKTEGQSVML